MHRRFSVTDPWRTATKHPALCCGFIGLSFLALVGFGLVQRTIAAENDLPTHSVSAAPTKIQPQLVASYGKLPLSFEANQGQTDARVRFLARGGGYTISLTDDEAVLVLRKSLPGQLGMTQLGKRGLPGWLRPFGLVGPPLGRWRSLANDLNSPALIPDLGQLVSGPNVGKSGGPAGPELPAPQVMRMRLVGGNAKGRLVGLNELPGRSNYFIGNDPKKWRTNVPSYSRVKYLGVYPGVDLLYYGNQGQLEYDFVVAPGADPSQIKLSFAGADGLRVDAASGDLVLNLGDNDVHFRKPIVYQPAVGACPDARPSSLHTLRSSFVLANHNQVAFRVTGYDPARPLVIDPVLGYSSYLGGSGDDQGRGIAVDAAGAAYVTGETTSTDFPTLNPFQANCASCSGLHYNVFVTKVNPAGSALVYSTYLGGSGSDVGHAIAVDAAGAAYVTGETVSTNFPTVSPFQATNDATPATGSSTSFVAKLSSTGSALVYSTYLGGSGGESGSGIAADSAGNAYVTGATHSTDFPTTAPFQANCDNCSNIADDVFVAKFNPAGSALVYSTYLGGSADDEGEAIAVDTAGNAYVTGETLSTNFPTANPIQANCDNCVDLQYDAFVAKFNPAGSALVYSTYLGGSSWDNGTAIAVGAAGDAYVTGWTSSEDFPTVNPFQSRMRGIQNAFVARLNPAGSALVYSTYLGGSNNDAANGIGVDSAGNAYVAGGTQSVNFPTVNAFQPTYGGGTANAFVAELNSAGSALVYSSFLGGSYWDVGYGLATDGAGNAYVTGFTYSTDFPRVDQISGACKGTCGSGGEVSDAFVSKIIGAAAPVVSLSPNTLTFPSQAVNTSSTALPVTLSNTGSATLSIASIVASTNFGETNDCEGSVAASGTCTINVTFTPTATGTLNGSLTITDDNNGVLGSTQTVTLTGTGTAPSVSLSTTSVSFSNQAVGTTSAPSPVTVTNNGTGSLNFTSIAVTGDFSVTASGTTCITSTSVAASSNCVINVTFTPTATGSRSGSLTLTDNASGSPQIVSLSGTGTAPAVGLSPTSVSFSNQLVGTTSTPSAVTVTNNGAASLSFTSIAVTGDFAVAATGTTCSTTTPVAASGNCVINVTFTPTATGSRSGSLTLTDNASGSPQTVSLSGTGTAPAVSLSPTSVTFSNQPVGTTSAASAVTVTNNGTASLSFTSIAATGDFAVAASGTTCSTSTPVAASGSCVINVTFTPTATGGRSGSLTLTDNASGSPQVVSLSGTGTAPAVSLSTTSVSFSNQPVGTTSALSAVTVTNSGTASLNFTSIAATGDFAVAASGTTCSTSASVAASSNCVVNLTFTPSATGSRSGSLTLTDNASGSPQTVSLSGTGTGPGVSLSPSSLSFPAQSVATSSTLQTVTLTNTGSTSLTISGITANGDFSQTDTCGSSVGAGANCSISVTFEPTAAGTRTGTLSISDNAIGSPQTVALSGTGQDFSFAPPSGSSTSATVAPGSPATYTLSVAGEGGLSGPVSFTCAGAPSEATCTVSPNPVTAGSSATSVTVTVTTTAPSISAPRSRPLSPILPLSPGLRDLPILALALSAMVWAIRRRNQPGVIRWHSTLVLLASGLLLTLALAGCGGGGGGGGTTTTTDPVASVSPSSLTFGSQKQGTTSASQPVTLSNTGTAALTVTSIGTTGNFGQTNNCPSSLGASNSCTINVTFSPAATGALTGTLTVTDNSNGVAGSSQSVPLTGTGANPGTPAGTYNLTVTGTTGSGSSALSHNVTLTLTVS
jgi:hypothetical protein